MEDEGVLGSMPSEGISGEPPGRSAAPEALPEVHFTRRLLGLPPVHGRPRQELLVGLGKLSQLPPTNPGEQRTHPRSMCRPRSRLGLPRIETELPGNVHAAQRAAGGDLDQEDPLG
jgi:hypothetical protein